MRAIFLLCVSLCAHSLVAQDFRKINGTVYFDEKRENNGWVNISGKIIQIVGKDALVRWDRFPDANKTIYLHHCPRASELIDGDRINCFAREVSFVEYTAVLGANKRVQAYDYGTPLSAAEWDKAVEERRQSQRLVKEEEQRRELAEKKIADARKADAVRIVKEKQQAMTARVVAFQSVQASNGYSGFQIELGKRYLRGDGVETNLSLAIHWLKSACTNHESEASNLLAKIRR